MANDTFLKSPDAVLDYKWDWVDWLLTDETIVTATVTAPTGLTKDSSSVASDGKSVTAWLSGGTADTDYLVTCHIETSNSPVRHDTRTILIQCRLR